MPFSSPHTARRLRHASGYLGLGMVAQAALELDAVDPADRESADVLATRVELLLEIKAWLPLSELAEHLAQVAPQVEQGWIHWAYALRELERIEEAKAVLLAAEPFHGKTCAVLHYNLACYECLLGNLPNAKRRLRTAIERDAHWKEAALTDPDLVRLRTYIAGLE